MDALRRGALARMGKILGGAAATGFAVSGRGARSQASANTYPKDVMADWAIAAPEPDPSWERRNAAAKPLHDKIEQHYQERRWALGDSVYLEGLKSPKEWWKRSVMMEREKRRQTAIESLQKQIEKLMETPMDKLEQFANDALAGFMAEWNKP